MGPRRVGHLLGPVLLRPKGFLGLLRPVLFGRTDGVCSFSSFSLLLLLHYLLFRLALDLVIVLLLFFFFRFCP